MPAPDLTIPPLERLAARFRTAQTPAELMNLELETALVRAFRKGMVSMCEWSGDAEPVTVSDEEILSILRAP